MFYGRSIVLIEIKLYDCATDAKLSFPRRLLVKHRTQKVHINLFNFLLSKNGAVRTRNCQQIAVARRRASNRSGFFPLTAELRACATLPVSIWSTNNIVSAYRNDETTETV